jgi:hypothetical protein
MAIGRGSKQIAKSVANRQVPHAERDHSGQASENQRRTASGKLARAASSRQSKFTKTFHFKCVGVGVWVGERVEGCTTEWGSVGERVELGGNG